LQTRGTFLFRMDRQLPPYAPKSNPMEHVWVYLPANNPSAPVCDGYDAILGACRKTWLSLVHDPDRIHSIGTGDLATVSFQGSWYRKVLFTRRRPASLLVDKFKHKSP
jgi:hypothetical protein